MSDHPHTSQTEYQRMESNTSDQNPPPYEVHDPGVTDMKGPAQTQHAAVYPPVYPAYPSQDISALPQSGAVAGGAEAEAGPYVVPTPDQISFGVKSVQVLCPQCKEVVNTKLRYKIGMLNWLACAGEAAVFFPYGLFGCCLFPFCMKHFKNVHHFCPNCNRKLGHHKHIRL